MKRDDVKKFFPDATDEQVSSILNAIGEELNPLKASVSDLTGRLTQAQGDLSASRASEAALGAKVQELTGRVEAGMTAEEQLAAREKAAAEREREFLLKSNALEAKAIFVAAGFPAEDIEALLPRVVGEDAEATAAAAKTLVDFDAKRRSAQEQATKDALLKENPHLGGAGGGGGVTREQFDKLTYAEQLKLVRENPGLLKQIDE